MEHLGYIKTVKKSSMKSLSSFLQHSRPSYGSYLGPKAKKENEVFDFLALVREWEKIVGPRLSKHTLPLKCDYKTLTILTNHPSLSGELLFMEEPIKAQVFKLFPALKSSIKKIKFQVNSSFFEIKQKQYQKIQPTKSIEEKRKFHPHSPLFQKLKRQAEVEFESIENDEIKEGFISLYIQHHSDC